MRGPRNKRLQRYGIGLILSALPLLFGGYLVYEKVALAIITGVTEERSGLTYRAAEPVGFWISVGMFAVFGSMIAALGLWGLWQTFKPDGKSDP